MLHQSLNLSYLPDFFIALFNVFCGAHNHLLYPVNIFILEEIHHESSYSTSNVLSKSKGTMDHYC